MTAGQRNVVKHRVIVALEGAKTMAEKSARKNTKTEASKTLKEKRQAKADKKASSDRAASTDAVSKVKNR